MSLEPKPSRTAAEAKELAQHAIFDAVRSGVNAIIENDAFGPADQANTIQALAVAYRLAAGGAQPGGISVDGK